jgi:hypothetical protein
MGVFLNLALALLFAFLAWKQYTTGSTAIASKHTGEPPTASWLIVFFVILSIANLLMFASGFIR